MSDELTSEEFSLLRAMIREECGIAVADDKAYLVRHRLGPIARRHGCRSFRELHTLVDRCRSGSVRDEIVDAMTTNETLWFRDDGPWEILRSEILPELSQKLASGDQERVRIWSAACSTGQEPYSIAMTILDHVEARGAGAPHVKSFEILATDVSAGALEVAEKGVYDQFAAERGLETGTAREHTERDGTVLDVNPSVRDLVTFRRFNLQDSFAGLGLFDVIFCRNVLIYFAPELRNEIAGKLRAALTDGGALILGASESLQGAMQGFKLARAGRHFYYRRKGETG